MLRKLSFLAILVATTTVAAFAQKPPGPGLFSGQYTTGKVPGNCGFVNGVPVFCPTNGGGAGTGANTFTGVQTAPGFATSGASQGFINLVQNSTAAPAQPANSFSWLAPQTGLTSSYGVIVPNLTPSANNSVMVVPNGGGQATWGVAALLNSANLFSQSQTIQSAAGGVLLTIDASPSTTAGCTQFNGGGTGAFSVQYCAGGQGFGANYFYTYDVTDGHTIEAINTSSHWLANTTALNFGSSPIIGATDVGIFRPAVNHLAIDNGSATNAGGFLDLNGIRSAGSNNTDLVGRLTLASGTATYTLTDPQGYTTHPACFANDEAATATLATCVCTTTVCTVHGTGTDVVDIHIVGFN